MSDKTMTTHLEKIMNRVSIHIDCQNETVAKEVYNAFVSQILDGKGLTIFASNTTPFLRLKKID